MMEIINHEITQDIKPTKLIFRNEIFEITKLADKYHIASYVVKTVDKKIDMVFLSNPHPNAIPRNGEFCISNSLRKHELNDHSKSILTCMLYCFNLDDCYFTPWDEIEYKKQEVFTTWQKNKD